MRVLVVASKYLPEYTGASWRIHNTYCRLRAAGEDVTIEVLTSGLECPGGADYQIDGVAVRRIAPLARWGGPGEGMVRRLGRAIRAWCEALVVAWTLRRKRPDLVHVFGTAPACAQAIRWARRRGLPLVVELVTAGASPHQSLPLSGHRPPDLRHRTAIICISDALMARCRALGLTANVWHRPNPVDVTRFHPRPRAQARALLGDLGPEDQVIGMIAKFMPQKNQAFLLQVLAALPAEWKLVLAGPLVASGPNVARDRAYFAALEQQVGALGLTGRVRLMPEMVDAAALMPAFDVYALPNTQEGLGTPMLEALACAVPVVANDAEPPFRQWLDGRPWGRLAPLQPAAWAAAILAAATIPQDVRMAGAADIVRRCAAEAIDRRFLALLRALVALPPDAGLNIADVMQKEAF